MPPPENLKSALDEAWGVAKNIPGFLLEDEARFLGLAAVCAPPDGAIVEIGSFKGKSTVMLAQLAHSFGLRPVVAIDPHNFNNSELQDHRTTEDATSFNEFVANLETAGVANFVDVRRAFSHEVAREWNMPIRFLWIDGDHTYEGAKRDFDNFMPYVMPGAIVALHDALHEFAGPIRVFVEEMLRSDNFGAAGFVGSIAWAQYRPQDGILFRHQRHALEKLAAPLIPFVKSNQRLRGLSKVGYKIMRSRVPRALPQLNSWLSQISL
jgi:predicted O-methyltransferase YrrM